MRKLFGLAILAMALVATVFCQGSYGGAPAAVKLATVWPLDHPVSKAIEEVFLPEVAAKTKGALKVQHYPNFQLGSNFEITQAAQMGTIELVAIGNELQNAVPELAVAELPFVFDNAEDAWTKFAGAYGKRSIDAMQKKGLKHLVWYERGFRQISANRPIQSIADLKGLKLRVSQVFLQSDMVETWGASPSIINWNEVYTALQQKVVEGQENPIDTIYASKIYEVNKHVAMTSHQFSFGYMMANLKWWGSLPPETQNAIQEAALHYQHRQDELLKQEYKGYIDKLKAAGVAFTNPDRAPFADKAPIIYNKFLTRYPDLKVLFEMLGKKL